VVALYAELDQRAEQLRQANDLKAQFLSYMSHEFRTPLDSMLALSGLLLARTDGPLTDEQETQVGFVRRSARDLLDMVDDLLAASRVDAGQVKVRPSSFTVEDVYNAVRAMLRPLMDDAAPPLAWEVEPGLPVLHTDEAKVAQILRNLISNALKFTERGEVRISAAPGPGEGTVVFRVADTGSASRRRTGSGSFATSRRWRATCSGAYAGAGWGCPLAQAGRAAGGRPGRGEHAGGGIGLLARHPFTYTEPAAQG
jgi:signal transduction histidine kinase